MSARYNAHWNMGYLAVAVLNVVYGIGHPRPLSVIIGLLGIAVVVYRIRTGR